MQSGVDLIVQAPLALDNWRGYADILIKVPLKSNLGDWSYEVYDTKLSQNTKAASILQLCLYTDLVATLQGEVPERMYIVKPGVQFPTESYRFAEFRAYYKSVKKNFEHTIAQGDVTTYPDPTSHCAICNWWQVCDRRRHADDHLSLVAGIRSLHVLELQRQQITTLEQLAQTEKIGKPERGNIETFIGKQAQAKVQLDGRIQGAMLYKLLDVEPGRGLSRLPTPDDGDIYFDIEGDAFYENGGLEYVLGYAFKEQGKLTYSRIWSSNRNEERKAFERFMQFVINRWTQFPKMHIYHFAPYETTAVKRMARVHAAFEQDVDKILRAERFIDLHAVFKEAMLAGVETYSLKELEKFTTYIRKVDLHDASSARKIVEIALELHDYDSISDATRQAVEEYNEDDCLATEALHHWLEARRAEWLGAGVEIIRPELLTGESTEKVEQLDARSAAIYDALVKSLPDDRDAWNDEDKVKWLLAHQIEYFRREDKSAWWEYFRVHELEHEELLDERKAITGLQFAFVLPKGKAKENATHRYTYPPQEISIDEGDALIEVKGVSMGSVLSISPENGTIDIRKAAKAEHIHPAAVMFRIGLIRVHLGRRCWM